MNLNNLHRLWEMNMNQILFERLFLVQLFLAFNYYSPSGSPVISLLPFRLTSCMIVIKMIIPSTWNAFQLNFKNTKSKQPRRPIEQKQVSRGRKLEHSHI